MNTALKLYTLRYNEARTYLMAALFIAGNIALPQLFHLIPLGGKMWLPIYFFTLIGAYKYGSFVGLLTAVVSPIANSLLFGMPMPEVLPSILIKSTLLAIAAGYIAKRYQKASFLHLIGVVIFYQIVGSLGEWILSGDLYAASQDFRIAIPGMLFQIIGGYFLINNVIRK
jgi:hypothetical protein